MRRKPASNVAIETFNTNIPENVWFWNVIMNAIIRIMHIVEPTLFEGI